MKNDEGPYDEDIFEIFWYHNSMKYIFMIMLLLLPAFVSAESQMQFMDRNHDFGIVEQGAKLEHVFDFENTGDTVLEIYQITPS